MGREAIRWGVLGLAVLLAACSGGGGEAPSADATGADVAADAGRVGGDVSPADATTSPTPDANTQLDGQPVGPAEDASGEPGEDASEPTPDTTHTGPAEDATVSQPDAETAPSGEPDAAADALPGDSMLDDIVDVPTNDTSAVETTDSTDNDTTDSDTTDNDTTNDAVADAAPGPDPCDQLAPLPLRWNHHGSLGGAEDYCLDNDGNMWAVSGGNLKKQAPDGSITLVTPNLHGSAGTGCLSDGRIVIAVEDSLVVAWPSGGYVTLLAGLEYPNGLDIDYDDTIYVAEQSGGRLRAVDPNTGDFQVIADELPSPNGVSFAPGYHRVYVGSFGGGWVHGLNRKLDGSWGEPWVLARIDKDNTPIIDEPLLNVPVESDYDPCGASSEGDPCITPDGWDGECVETAWGRLCQRSSDASPPGVVACQGKAADDACSISILGEPFPGLCRTPDTAPVCCSTSDDAGCINGLCQGCVCAEDSYCCNVNWDGACSNIANGKCAETCGCWAGGTIGGTGVEPLACYGSFDPMLPCKHLDVGDDCTLIRDSKSFFQGKCTNLQTDPKPPPYAKTGVGCVSEDLEGGGGGLDGLNVDACGNVYVTEYVLGYVWRIDPMGGISKVVKLPNYWIPNLEFGRGVGGYKSDSLFVIPINQPFLFELPAGVFGKEVTMPSVP